MTTPRSAQTVRDALESGSIPLVLCGPVLRRVEPDAATVWIALRESRTVTLHVRERSGDGEEVLSGTRGTIPVGEHLHLVAVTASPIRSGGLSEGVTYAYDLDFGQDETLTSRGVLSTAPVGAGGPISYGAETLPTFSLPPSKLEHLRVLYGSCRKPRGNGHDMLPAVDRLIEQAHLDAGSDRELALARPHLLMLMGDQIYADEVADPLLAVATETGDALLGWQESLPWMSTLSI